MKEHILHLPKWFPNKFDEQNGIFIKKHICAVKDSYAQTVLSIFKDPDLNQRLRVNVEKTDHVTYVSVSFKPYGNKIFDVLMYGFLNLRYGWKLSKNTNIIHTHVMGRNVFIAWLISILRPVKLVHTEHWSLFINAKQWKSKSKLYKKVTAFLLKRMHQVLAVSQPLNKKLLSIYPNLNSEVIGNVISENPYSTIEKHQDFTFIHVSDLRDDIKNISGVINAFAQYKNQISSSAKLHIIGDGPDRSKLETLAKGNTDIIFLGRQANEEVYKALNQAHVLVLNSTIETFGMVILEAFSCGLPVICAKNRMSEYFVDSSSGLVIEQNDTEGLASALEKIEQTYSNYLPDQLKEKAKPFSELVIGNKIKRVYKKIIHET